MSIRMAGQILPIAGLLVGVLAAGSCGAAGDNEENPAPDIGSVAILVVDSFDPNLTGLPDKDQESEGDCAYASLPANVVGGKGAPDTTLPTGVAHGTLVFDELAGKLNANPRLAAVSNPSQASYGAGDASVKRFGAWTYGNHDVVLVGLETASYQATAIQAGIKKLIEDMGNVHAFQRFVLNMSFVMAPCGIESIQKMINDAHSAPDVYRVLIDGIPELNNLRDELEALAQVSPGKLPAQPELQPATAYLTDSKKFREVPDRTKIRMFYGPSLNAFLDRPGTVALLGKDPLLGYLQELSQSTDRRVISVAAAGNGVGYWTEDKILGVRLDFPFAPALWNVVLSVSADDQNNGIPASYSNSGEVMADGTYKYGTFTLHGTSFAAALISYEQALFLLTGGRQKCGSDVPPLGYADFENQVRQWNNLPLGQAISEHCQEFAGRGTAQPAHSSSGP